MSKEGINYNDQWILIPTSPFVTDQGKYSFFIQFIDSPIPRFFHSSL